MQFSIFLTGVVSVLAGTTAALKIDLRGVGSTLDTRQQNNVVDECIDSNDCCFSTVGACQRQASVWAETYLQCPFIDLCPKKGVSVQACNADCCSISRKAGRGCPGK